MFAIFFEKTTLKSYFTSSIICFVTVFFIHFCKNKGTLNLELIPKTIFFWILFLGIIWVIGYLENKNSVNNFRAIHLLSFPLVYLFFPHGKEVVFIKVFIGILLIIGKYSFSRIFIEKKSYMRLFDLSFVISLLILYNGIFFLFLIIPISVLFSQKYRDSKHLVSLATPLIAVPVIFRIFQKFFLDKTTSIFDFYYSVNTWKIEENLYYSEVFWFTAIFIAIIASLLFRPKRYEKNSSQDRQEGFLYMTFWLYISIIIGYFSLHKGDVKWFLSFIPVAYFFGIFLDKIKLNNIKNIVIYLLFITAVIFKLIENQII